MSVAMAIKPCKLVLKNMNEKDSSNSSEASTPEEYLTPSGESVLLSDTSAFSFPDLDRENQSVKDKSLDNVKLINEVNNKERSSFDENLNRSSTKCNPNLINDQISTSIAPPSMNSSLNKRFEALEKDIETRPTKLKPDKQIQSTAKLTGETSNDGDLVNIRKKLEERRRKMEMEKKKQEQQWSQQRQAVSKEAYSALFGGEGPDRGEFRLSSEKDAPSSKTLQNGKDDRTQPSGYYRQDSAIAMEKLFANEELADSQPSTGTLDRNFIKRQRAAREVGTTQLGRSSLERKKTSSFRESSTNKSKTADQRHSVDPNYGLSLDRLNSSLSELQGEIMRLSLQQDHIKNLVSLADSNYPTLSQRSAQPDQNPPRSEPSRESAGGQEKNETTGRQQQGGDVGPHYSTQRNSAFRRYSESRGFTQRMPHGDGYAAYDKEFLADRAYHDGTDEEIMNQHGNIPYPHPAVIPAISPFPFLHPLHPPPFYPYGINPYYQPYTQPHYSLRSRPYRNFDYRRDVPLRRDLSLGGIQDSGSASRRHETSRRDSVSAGRSSYAPPKGGEYRRPSSVVSDYFSSQMSYDRSPYDPEGIYFQSYSARKPSLSSAPGDHQSLQRQTSQTFYAPNASVDASFNSSVAAFEAELEKDTEETGTECSETDGDEDSTKSLQQPEFFVVDLEAPKRPKPEIGSQRRSKAARENSLTSSSPSRSQPQVAAPPPAVTEEKVEGVEVGAVQQEAAENIATDEDKTETSSVGFVIEETEIEPLVSAEVEKKKLRMAELHQRRKDELEAKKTLINKDQMVKKEQLRLKEENALKKKTEDKQRRDKIFQKYLQRKAEMSETNSDDDSVKQLGVNSSAVNSTAKSPSSRLRPPSQAKRQRPQSQLVVSSANKEINSDFSDDSSLVAASAGHPLGSERRPPTTPDPGKTSDNCEGSKKSAQDKFSRFLSCGSEAGTEDSSGLKLFVKPNQKSNRNIIMNAIKDCCLAGVVNQDLKNRVLEELGRNESKHFVVLFRDAGLQYRGLYSYNPERQEVLKIHGVGPKQLVDKAMEKFFKYNSGSKNFSEVTSTKHLSSTIDGVTILSCLWNKKQQSNVAPKKST